MKVYRFSHVPIVVCTLHLVCFVPYQKRDLLIIDLVSRDCTTFGFKKDEPNLLLNVAHISKRGVPTLSLICTALVSLVTFATSFIPGKALFVVLTKLSGVAGFVTWGGICFAHYRFRKALKYHGRSIYELPIKAPWHPFGDLFGMVACVVIALMAGYSYFVPADPVGLVGNYGGLVVCAILFVVLKFYTKSKMIPVDQIDIDTGKADFAYLNKETDEDDNVKLSWGKKIIHFVT